jgi:hypothetical protein
MDGSCRFPISAETVELRPRLGRRRPCSAATAPSPLNARSPSWQRMRALFLLLPLIGSACVAEATPSPQLAAVQPVPAPAQQDCREFNTSVAIGGQQQPAYGTACLQPDGSWKIEQHVGDQAPQTYVVSPQQYLAYYPPVYYEDPWFFGPPLFVGGIFIGGGREFHHRFAHFHGGFHHGFHAGFHGGFHGRR